MRTTITGNAAVNNSKIYAALDSGCAAHIGPKTMLTPHTPVKTHAPGSPKDYVGAGDPIRNHGSAVLTITGRNGLNCEV